VLISSQPHSLASIAVFTTNNMLSNFMGSFPLWRHLSVCKDRVWPVPRPEVASCLTPNTITAVRVLALLPYMSLTLSVCPWSGLGTSEWVLKHMRYTTCTGHGNLSFVCSIQPVYQETVWSHVWEIRSELPLLGYIWLCWV